MCVSVTQCHQHGLLLGLCFANTHTTRYVASSICTRYESIPSTCALVHILAPPAQETLVFPSASKHAGDGISPLFKKRNKPRSPQASFPSAVAVLTTFVLSRTSCPPPNRPVPPRSTEVLACLCTLRTKGGREPVFAEITVSLRFTHLLYQVRSSS